MNLYWIINRDLSKYLTSRQMMQYIPQMSGRLLLCSDCIFVMSSYDAHHHLRTPPSQLCNPKKIKKHDLPHPRRGQKAKMMKTSSDKKGVKQRRFGAWMNPTSMKLDRTSPQFDFWELLNLRIISLESCFGSMCVVFRLDLTLYYKHCFCCREERRYDESGTCEADEMTMFRSRLIRASCGNRKCFFFSLSVSLPLSRPLHWFLLFGTTFFWPRKHHDILHLQHLHTGCAWFADWLLSRRFFPWGISCGVEWLSGWHGTKPLHETGRKYVASFHGANVG